MTNIYVDYNSHYDVEPWKWQGAKFSVSNCMDNSQMGMCFLYRFKHAEDATAFKLLFGHCIK